MPNTSLVTSLIAIGYCRDFADGRVERPCRRATPVSIATPRGAKQAFILIKPEKPVASVILFAGGHGALGLQSATAMKWGTGKVSGAQPRPVRRA